MARTQRLIHLGVRESADKGLWHRSVDHRTIPAANSRNSAEEEECGSAALSVQPGIRLVHHHGRRRSIVTRSSAFRTADRWAINGRRQPLGRARHRAALRPHHSQRRHHRREVGAVEDLGRSPSPSSPSYGGRRGSVVGASSRVSSPGVVGSTDTAPLTYIEQQAAVCVPQSRQGLAVAARDADRHHSEHRKSPIHLLPVHLQPAPVAEAVGSHHATAVPSSSTIWPGIASRVTSSIVVVGATPTTPNRAASTP